VVWALRSFRPYVHGKPFTVVTDSNAVTYLPSKRQPSPKLIRWALELQEYAFETQHRKGTRHQDVDFFSRLTPSDPLRLASIGIVSERLPAPALVAQSQLSYPRPPL